MGAPSKASLFPFRVVSGLLLLGAAGRAGHVVGDPATDLVWLSLWALPAGWLAGAWTAPWSARGAAAGCGAIGALWWLALELQDRLPDPGGAAFAASFLLALGCAAGRLTPGSPWAWFARAALLGACLHALPSLLGCTGAAPWPPEAAARWLDLAPSSWVVESAGLDWMRHPWVYDPVGSSSIGPELRSAYQPGLAQRAVLLGSCGVLFWAADHMAPSDRASARSTRNS